MIIKITKKITILLSILFGIFFAGNVSAEEDQLYYYKYVTSQEMKNGYSVSFDSDKIKLETSKQSQRGAFVEMLKPKTSPKIPLDKKKISEIYNFSVLPATDNTLSEEITITIKYKGDEKEWKEIYIYQNEKQEWKKITGEIENNNQIKIKTNQASGFIAVFQDNLYKSDYTKEKIDSPVILVSDAKTGETLIERKSEEIRPIASLTKLMTAAVFLDNNPGWDKKIKITKEDDAIPSKIYVNPGETITTQDLFYATLIKSANNAAKALARSTGLTKEEFVKKMNEKAKELGMKNTYFEEETGLSEKNVSTAQDLFLLSKKLFSDIVMLKSTTPKKMIIKTAEGKKITLENSNKALDTKYPVLGSKTGYTPEAGRCVIMKTKNKDNKEIIAITIGTEKPGAQWTDIKTAIDAALSK